MYSILNLPLIFPFTSAGLTTGLTSFTPRFLLNGSVVTPTAVYTEIGGGLYTLTITPTATGSLSIFIEGILYSPVEIITQTLSSQLQDIVDESLGSWQWDKSTGILQMYRTDGSLFHTYNVADTVSNASRELVS